MRIFTVAITVFMALAPVPILAQDTYVRGYMRSDGSYVQPHYRTERNETQQDNYSTKGNVNPYNGRQGYIIPDRDDNNSYNSGYGGSSSQQTDGDGNNSGFFGQDNRKRKSGYLLDND